MKVIKHFFNHNNKLNKGYGAANSNTAVNDTISYNKNLNHILPPIEIMQEYEDIYPGSVAKIIGMAEKEQAHKHNLELINLKSQEQKLKLAKNIALLSILIFAASAIMIALLSNNIYIIIITITILAAIAAYYLLNYKMQNKSQPPNQSFNNNRYKQNKFRRKNGYRYK